MNKQIIIDYSEYLYLENCKEAVEAIKSNCEINYANNPMMDPLGEPDKTLIIHTNDIDKHYLEFLELDDINKIIIDKDGR